LKVHALLATALQKKLLEHIYILWKKDEAFDPHYQDKQSRDVELAPSFTLVPQEPSIICTEEETEIVMQKITPAITRVTQDKHPSKYRRLPSFT